MIEVDITVSGETIDSTLSLPSDMAFALGGRKYYSAQEDEWYVLDSFCIMNRGNGEGKVTYYAKKREMI